VGVVTAGDLTVEEQLDPALYRYTRVARVIDQQHRPPDRLPPLIDATLLWVRGGRMALTGFERLAGLGVRIGSSAELGA